MLLTIPAHRTIKSSTLRTMCTIAGITRKDFFAGVRNCVRPICKQLPKYHIKCRCPGDYQRAPYVHLRMHGGIYFRSWHCYRFF